MNVRMADYRDIDTLIALRYAYFEAEKWVVSEEDDAVIRRNLLPYFSRELNDTFFAALVEDGDEVASAAFLIVSKRPANPFFPTGKIGIVYNVLTFPQHRKKGYATEAVKALIEEGKRQNLSYLELTASHAGKPLYEKLGFSVKAASEFAEMKLSLR